MLIFELANRAWDIPVFRDLLLNKLSKINQLHGMEIIHSFPVIGEKILLVNACKVVQKIHQQQLILLAFEDITELRKHGG